MTKGLLAISWDMPPMSGPRAVQVSRTVKHLVPLGWESSVVCFEPRSRRYNQDPDLAARLRAPAGVALVRVPSLEEHWIFRTLWRVAPPIKLLPDEKWVWIGRASRAARQLAARQRFDVLISFAQPWSDHLVGLRVRRATGLPWVAHFSDPWTDSPYLHGRRWQWRIWRRMEADVIESASAVVFVNAQTAERVMGKYPDAWRTKAHIVPHGFDRGDLSLPPMPSATDARLHIVYTGRFYEGIRTPEPMLRALAALATRRPLAQELRVTFVGTSVPAYEQLADRLGLRAVIEFTGRVPFAASAAYAAAADVLLVIDAPSDNSLFLPSKLIDYLPLGRPILGLTPASGASADLLRSLGHPIVPPDDETAIASAIAGLIDAKHGGRLGVSPAHDAVAAQYDIRATTRALADILAAVRVKPRVMMVTGAYYPETSGGGLQARAVARALRRDADFVVLTTSADPSLPSRSEEDGIPIHRVHVDVQSAASTLTAGARFAAAFTRLAPAVDIVNLHGFSRKAIMLAALSRLFGKRFVLTLQTSVHDEPPAAKAAGAATYWAYRSADLYLSVSPGLSRGYLAAGLPGARLRQVSNAVDTDVFRPPAAGERDRLRRELGLPADLALVLFVGFFSRDKRPDLMYRAWADIAAQEPASRLLMIGATRAVHGEVDATLGPEIRAQAAHDHLADRLFFVEATATIETYFRAADLYVLPSVREGLPLALIEAMASGLPCIATRLEGATDVLIDDRVNGLLVPPDDRAGLAAALRRLLRNRVEAARLGAAARATVVERYAIRTAARPWLAAYQELAAS